ncbi:unnamed protein product, partial [Ectocarpus sp. 13 AM-2016]
LRQGKSGREEHGHEKPQQQRQQQQPVLRKSCDYCARMKRACDGGSPCALCSRRGKVCERRLRRKSGPAKGAKYAPRRRKFENEAAALAEEEAAAAAEAAATVASLKDKERNRGGFNMFGGGGGGYGDTLDSSGEGRSGGGGCSGGGGAAAAAVAVVMKPVRRIQESKRREENDRPPSGGGGSPSAALTSPATATATATPPPAGRPPVLKTEEKPSTSKPQPQPQPQQRNQEHWRKRRRGEKRRGSSCSDDSSSTSSTSRGSAETPPWSRGVPRKRRFPSKGWARAAGRGGGERGPASPSGDSRGRTGQPSGGDERAFGGVGVGACGGGGGEVGRESSRRNESSSTSSGSSGSSEAPCYSAAAAAPVSCYNTGPAEDLRPSTGGSRPYSPKDVARVPRREEGAEEEEEEARGVWQRNRHVDRHHPPERQASRGGDVETTTRSPSLGTGWTAAARAAAAAAAVTRTTTRSPAAVAGEAVEQGGRRCRPSYPKQEVRDDVDYTAGRVVSVSPLKKAVTGEGGDEEGPDHQGEGGRSEREIDGGRDASPPRVQAWEPTVEAAGIGLDVGSYAGRAAGLRNQWAGSLRPKEQQPLAPKDLLLMLRPNSEGFFDYDGAEKRSGTQATHIKGGGG